MTRRRVVFSADDLGMGPAANAGIRRAAATGLVREASLCVTGPAPEAALEAVAKHRATLGIGLHLSFSFGRALTGKILGMTDEYAGFFGLPRLLAVCLSGRAPAATVEHEVRAQLARLHALGVGVTHLNGHHHVHVLPTIRDAVLNVLRDHPELHVRLPRAGAMVNPRAVTLAWLSSRFVARAAERGVALRSLPCVGLASSQDEPAARFERVLAELDAPATEWVVHPRLGDETSADGGGRLGRLPQGELEVLESAELKESLAHSGIEPASFRDLHPQTAEP